MRDYYANWDQCPLSVVPVPEVLNPFRGDNVDLSVAVAGNLLYENIKCLTVLGLFQGAFAKGMLEGVHTLVEATSGNTGLLIKALAKPFGIKRAQLVVPPDIPEGKRHPLVMAGAELITAQAGLSAIATARNLGGGGWKAEGWQANNGCLNLDQYANPDGTTLHESFTGPKIVKRAAYPPTVFAAGIGTGGTLVGVSRYLSKKIPKAKAVGVLLATGQEIPGVRDMPKLSEVSLAKNWLASGGETVLIPTRPSYLAAIWFNQIMGIAAGPSSGFAYLGALKFLKKHKAAKTLHLLHDHQGRIHVVILFPDGNRPYGDRFMANLPSYCLDVAVAPLPWEWPGNQIW